MDYITITDILLEELQGIKPVKLPYALDALEPKLVL